MIFGFLLYVMETLTHIVYKPVDISPDIFQTEVFPNSIYLYWDTKEFLDKHFYIYISNHYDIVHNDFLECRIVRPDRNGQHFENVFSDLNKCYISIYCSNKLVKLFELEKLS